MSKVTYRFLKGVKQEVHKEIRENKDYKPQSTEGGAQDSLAMFSDDLYIKTPVEEDNTSPASSVSSVSSASSASLASSTPSSTSETECSLLGFDDSMYDSEDNSSEETANAMDDTLYYTSSNQKEIEVEVSNTDEFIQYSIDFNSKVSAKEARTSIESRLPFIVDKADFKSFSDQRASNKNKKSAIIRETDSIYKMQTKMRKSGISSEYITSAYERIGFITVSKTPQSDFKFNSNASSDRAVSKTKKLDSIVGILNQKFIIHKKKGFNKKKLGYLPVTLSDIQTIDEFDNVSEDEIISEQSKKGRIERERAYYDRLYKQKKLLEQQQERDISSDNSVQRYVEVVEDRGIARFIFIIALIVVIWFIINTLLHSPLADGWSRDGLNLIKTEEQTVLEESNIAITMNATPTLKNNELNINLSSQKVKDLSFTLEIIDNETNEIVYSSEELPSGSEIEQIETKSGDLPEALKEVYFNTTDENIYRVATVRCETYKNNIYLGEIEQEIEIKIKPIQ